MLHEKARRFSWLQAPSRQTHHQSERSGDTRDRAASHLEKKRPGVGDSVDIACITPNVVPDFG